MKKLIVNLFLKAFTSKTTQNVAIAAVVAKFLLDLAERYVPGVPWSGTFAEVLTYGIGLVIAAITTALLGRVIAVVKDPSKLG